MAAAPPAAAYCRPRGPSGTLVYDRAEMIDTPRPGGTPLPEDPPVPDIVLYSRPACGLCDETRHILEALLADAPHPGSRPPGSRARHRRPIPPGSAPTSPRSRSSSSPDAAWSSRRAPPSSEPCCTTSWTPREPRCPGSDLTLARRARRRGGQFPLAVRPAARARVPRTADRHRGRRRGTRRPAVALAGRPTRRSRTWPASGRCSRSSGSPRPSPPARSSISSPAPRHRWLRARVHGAQPGGHHPDPALERTWRPLDAGASSSLATATGTMASLGGSSEAPVGDRLGVGLVSHRGGWLASFGLGAIFAIGWTPCIGIILGRHPDARDHVGHERSRARSCSSPTPSAWACRSSRSPSCTTAPRRSRGRWSATGARCRSSAGCSSGYRPRDALRLALAAAALLQLQHGVGLSERTPTRLHASSVTRGTASSGRSAAASSWRPSSSRSWWPSLVGVTTPLGTTGAPPAPDPQADRVPHRPGAPGPQAGRPRARVLGDPPPTARPSSSTDLDGKPVRLADLRGKAVWVNFWATLVPALPAGAAGPARALGALQGRRARGPRGGVQETSPADVQAFADKYQLATRRVRHLGRHLPPVQGLRLADPGLHRPRRDHPRRRLRAADRGPGRTARSQPSCRHRPPAPPLAED